METKKIDRTGWAAGPWDNEGDEEKWVDEATGYQCLMLRNSMGAWCGYVAVPKDHPLHGKSYDDAHGAAAINVHGGLTFDGERAEPGQWFLGFDCNHYRDRAPGLESLLVNIRNGVNGPGLGDDFDVYRTAAYVRDECTNLARQLKEAA